MTVIADPLFYLAALPAVIFLGLSKGGFSGIGMVSTPLLALILPPLEAASVPVPRQLGLPVAYPVVIFHEIGQ